MAGTSTDDVTEAVSRAFRDEWGQIVSTVIRITGDWDLAEECAQDAFVKAVERWPADGIPGRPGAWLTTTARNRAIDRRRREARGLEKLAVLAREGPRVIASDAGDECEVESCVDPRLMLLFSCCHPLLSLESRVTLTLRSVAGLGTSEIACAFRLPEMTVSKRLVRAKKTLRGVRREGHGHGAMLTGARLDVVLDVILRIFHEGRRPESATHLVRRDLCAEAIRLARLLVELMPGEHSARELLALLCFQCTRFTTPDVARVA